MKTCRTCGFTDCPSITEGGPCPRWTAPDDGAVCACGHDRGSHWDGHGKCGWCGTPGNGIFPCVVFTDGAEFRAAHGEHVAHFLGEFF